MDLTINIPPKNIFIKLMKAYFLTTGERFVDLVAHIQRHKGKIAFIQCSLSEIALSWFLRLHEN